jgi:para-aminobenzoate synthetase / 4-amino-4-deoxychorismate lyase
MEGTRVILEFPGSGCNAGTLRFGTPAAVISARRLEEVRPALRAATEAAAAGATVAGFVSYEAAPAFDSAFLVRPHTGPAPLVWFGVFDTAAGAASACTAAGSRPRLPRLAWQPDVSREQYDAALREIRDRIAAGDVYQVNYTLRFRARGACDPETLYHALAAPRHGRYHALIETPEWALVSASPELFIDVRDGIVTTRPMKGTARRGRWLDEDRTAAEALANSAKDRAENLMIVDLLRNDLGRIAQFGSVHVSSMFDIETYPTVHQMTSTITARLRDDCTIDDIFSAMFPCGSVTGAPKIAAMQQIARLETAPRGPYCGAVGVLRPDGSATFNVAIRTVLLDRRTHTATYGSGSGITWDSAVAGEYDETAAKAALLTDALPPFELIETLRLEDGVLRRLDLHLERLRRSCTYWNFAAHTPDAARVELEYTARCTPRGRWRVRLSVADDGQVHITRTPLDRDVSGGPDVALASRPVDSRDRLLYHKTSARAIYDAHRAEHPDAFDVLLYNEHGLVTEFTIGNVVCDIAGELVTPPTSDGLLAGAFREELLRAGTISERSITIAEALACPRVWLINSVREWVPVSFAVMPALNVTERR